MKTLSCFVGQPEHLVGPGIPNVTSDDSQLRKGECDLVEIGDRAAGLGRHQRTGLADLGAERDIQLDALHIKRVVVLDRWEADSTATVRPASL